MITIKLSNRSQQSAINQAVKVLSFGGLIVYPTETCYGLGADATNPASIHKLLSFKTRREGKAISVVVADQQMAQKFVNLNQTARHLYHTFLPGPLTVVSQLQPSSAIAPGLASEKGTLGIRIPDYPFILNLVKRFSRPITATSANVSYQPQPYSLSQWLKNTPKKSQGLIDLFIDAGRLPHRPSSTVIDTTTDELTVIRQGSIKIQKPSAVFTTHSEAETQDLAVRIIKQYRDTINSRGLLIALQGELGAGKTIFAQGVAKYLGIKDQVKSPTFTLVHEYLIPETFFTQRSRSASCCRSPQTSTSPFRLRSVNNAPTFYHLDTWRLEKSAELLDLGFKQMLTPGNLVVIEWAEKVLPIVEKLCLQHHVPLITVAIDVLNPTSRRWKFS